MLRRSQAFLRVSPFSLFLQDASKSGKLKGSRNAWKTAAKIYRRLSPAEKSALTRRAKGKTFPIQKAHQRMAKREMGRLRHTPILKRQEHVKAKGAPMKRSRASTPSKTVPSAKKKVKATVKTAKKIAKTSSR